MSRNVERPRVLAVSKWSDVFETCESRRYKSLTWVALPVSFNSTGLQRLLDEFDGPTAAALYGCWNALLKVAATAPTRGVLAGQKGEPYTAGRLARLSGFPCDLFEKLIDWCLTVGWLVDNRVIVELPDITEHNLTKPDRTGPDKTKPVELQGTGPARSGGDLFFKAMQERAAGKSQELPEAMKQPIEPISDSRTPGKPLQCWAAGLWEDATIARLSDATNKTESRKAVFDWFRRQLAAPDPVVAERTTAAAVCVLALAETAATRPGLKNRSAWFRSQLRPSAIPSAVAELSSKHLNAAAKFVVESVTH